MPRAHHPGDDARSAHFREPDIVAAEQRVLTLADGMLAWMNRMDFGKDTGKMVDFFTHHTHHNPGGEPLGGTGETTAWALDRLDPDTNRHFVELLRAAWTLRCWRKYYGEIRDIHTGR